MSLERNLDRIFALWQAVNPRSFLQSEENTFGTFVTPPGSINTLDSGI
jgi:hypothetical protein